VAHRQLMLEFGGATYPKDSIDVYSDAEVGHAVNIAAHEAAQARFLAETIKEAFVKKQTASEDQRNSITYEPYSGDGTEAPGYAEADAEASRLEAAVVPLVHALKDSILTFHIRGLAPAQWRNIDAKWRKAIKPPARKNFPQTEEGEEEFNLATYERDLERITAIKNDQIASGVFKVVRKKDGAVDTHVWTVDEIADINDTYMTSEYDKLQNLVVQLTFANSLFNIAVEKDAAFL
jgi:hypothetical protein